MLGDKLSQRIATGTSGALVQNKTTVAVGGGLTSVPAEGDYFLVQMGGALVCEVQDDAGAWQTLYPAGQGGLISSDGANLRIRNTNAGGGASANYSLLKLG